MPRDPDYATVKPLHESKITNSTIRQDKFVAICITLRCHLFIMFDFLKATLHGLSSVSIDDRG